MKGALTAEIIEALRPIIAEMVNEAVAAKLADDPRLRNAIRTEAATGRRTFRDRSIEK